MLRSDEVIGKLWKPQDLPGPGLQRGGERYSFIDYCYVYIARVARLKETARRDTHEGCPLSAHGKIEHEHELRTMMAYEDLEHLRCSLRERAAMPRRVRVQIARRDLESGG